MILDERNMLSYFPLVLTAVLGALNDNLIKAAVIVFAALSVPADEAATVGLLAGALLMAPYVIFSGWAGIIADRYEKAGLIRVVKWSEMALAGAATGAMLLESIPLMLGVVFLMGTQSAFFGPLKHGWLPERLRPDQLVASNSWIDTGVFFAILGGTVIGGLLAGGESLVWAGYAAIAIALLGTAFCRMLPVETAAAPELEFPLNPLAGNWRILKALFADPVTGRAAILASWFWTAGSIYLSTLPAQLRQDLGGDERMMTAILALFAIGIGAGAFTATRKLKGRVSAAMVGPSSALITVAAFCLYAGFGAIEPDSGLAGLFASPAGLVVVGSLFAVAFGGGLFAVPLKAVIQDRAGAVERGQVMAGFGMLSSIAIVAASLLTSFAVSLGLAISHISLAVAVSALVALAASIAFFPRAALQGLGRLVLKRWFRIEIDGEKHLATKGPVVFVANHTSFADGPLLFSLIDRDASIAVNTGWAEKGLLSALSRILRIAPIDPQNPMAAKGLANTIREGGAALIFPEGRISTHGGLMKVYPGTAWLIDAARAPVVSINIEGLESSTVTRPIAGMARRLFPKVRIRVEAPRYLDIPPESTGAARRQHATRALQDTLEASRFRALSDTVSIPHAFHKARQGLSSRAAAVCDPTGTSLTRRKLAIGAAAFSALLRERTDPGETVGVLLPGAAGSPVALMGLWRAGRVAAILNPTLGSAPMLSAIDTAGIRRILTSREFVDKADIAEVVENLEQEGIEILWTDDLKAEITMAAKLRAMRAARRPDDVCLFLDDPAVVLFTSGTEGAPKGVVLTHENLIANVAQLRARTDIGPGDKVLSALPLFHGFGLTAGVLLPLLAGAPVMLYPSPLHYRIIPELAYNHRATLIFGTDTFLNGWGRRASAYDFSSVRAAIAGAEPVKDATRQLWSDQFGVRILEGFGATEAGPVIALNTPMENRSGTVGRSLPGIETRLEDAPGIDGHKLWIKGPNIMAGYLLAHDKGTLHAPAGGWHDTGDIITRDDDGFIRIVGRAKRFAKIGGEMVSLAAVEVLAAGQWPDNQVAAISVEDKRKGEKVILVTDRQDADRKSLSEAAKAQGVAEITVPSEVMVIDTIPLLASGKTDYPALMRLQDAEATRPTEPA